jgi:uncharacterized protein (DUF934 family)
MLAKPQIIKNGLVIDDNWTMVELHDDLNVDDISGQSIVPLSLWQSEHSLKRDNIGLLINNDVDLATISEDLTQLPLIAIHFPSFMDGRGFSIARLLRERYGYKGEIRAVGYVIRDQLCYLKRCGFDAFSFNPENILGAFDLTKMAASLNDFTNAYQISADTPTPLFRRRA